MIADIEMFQAAAGRTTVTQQGGKLFNAEMYQAVNVHTSKCREVGKKLRPKEINLRICSSIELLFFAVICSSAN